MKSRKEKFEEELQEFVNSKRTPQAISKLCLAACMVVKTDGLLYSEMMEMIVRKLEKCPYVWRRGVLSPPLGDDSPRDGARCKLAPNHEGEHDYR